MLSRNPYRRTLGIIALVFFSIAALLFIIAIVGFGSAGSSSNPFAQITTATTAMVPLTFSFMSLGAGLIIGTAWLIVAALTYDPDKEIIYFENHTDPASHETQPHRAQPRVSYY